MQRFALGDDALKDPHFTAVGAIALTEIERN
jgi:hypothetical protein